MSGRAPFLARIVAIGLMAAGVACAGPANELLDRPGGRIRVAYTSTPDLADVPSLLAHRLLGERGYSIETVFYSQPELAASALSRRDVDVAIGSLRTFWASALQGAPIVAVMEAARNDHQLLTDASIRSCAELGGRRVASHSAGSVGYALLRAYILEECPGTEPIYLQVPGSSSRMNALLSGAIDAAVLQRDDVLRVGRRHPDRTHVLEVFGRRWPKVATTAVLVNTEFARTNPRAVEDYVTACLRVYREARRDAGPLAREAARVFETSDDLHEVVTAYLEAGTWDPNGGFAAGTVEDTFQFFVRTGSLNEERVPAVLVDRTFLDRALASLALEERRLAR